MPGRDPGGFIVTALIGIVGAFIGGFIGNMITGAGLNGFSLWSILLAIVGSLLLLGIISAAVAYFVGTALLTHALFALKNNRPVSFLQAMRDSGLSHLLSISGLHMAIVAGFVFVGLRGLLALVPRLALYYPIFNLGNVFIEGA